MYLFWKITFFSTSAFNGFLCNKWWAVGKEALLQMKSLSQLPLPCLAVFTATPDVTESWPSTRYLQKCCWFRILHPQWGSLLRPLTPTSHTHNAWWLTGDHARYSRVVANSCYSFYSGFGIFIFFLSLKSKILINQRVFPWEKKHSYAVWLLTWINHNATTCPSLTEKSPILQGTWASWLRGVSAQR